MTFKKFSILAATGVIPIGVFLMLPMGTWADLNELPLHPLIVHGVIVALPVAALWLLVAAWKSSVFRQTHLVVWTLSVVATLGVIAAKSSGDSLSAAVGLPDTHADAGNRLIPVTIAMSVTVLAMILFSFVRPSRVLATGSRALGALTAIAVLPLTYLAGHSGAESVWEEPYAEAQLPIAPGQLLLSMNEVRRHADPSDCWTVVDGVVYDMTTFIERHPAGAGDIIDMCGEDATDDFLGEHGGQGEPEKWLATLKIGTLDD